MNSGKQLLSIRANTTKNDLYCIEIDILKREKRYDSTQIDFVKYYKREKEHLPQQILTEKNLQINEIDTKIYDEEGYFNSHRMAKGLTEAFLHVNYESKCFKSFHLDTKTRTTNQLNEINFTNELISSISGSNLIRGECSILTNNGNIYLSNELSSNEDNLQNITKNLQPIFKSDFDWKSIKIGAQPRQFVYSDHSQITAIDSRIKTSVNHLGKEIFKPVNKYLDPNELICRTDIIENDYNYHLACCSKSLVLIDERFPNRPLLTWKHFLKSPAQFLKNNFLTSNRNLVLCSDSNDIYLYQFSTKVNNVPVAIDFDRKLDRPLDIIDHIQDSYDKRLTRYLNNRLGSPILSLGLLRNYDSFALFQVDF